MEVFVRVTMRNDESNKSNARNLHMRPHAYPILTVIGVNNGQIYAGGDEEILQNLVENLRREGGEQRCGGGGDRHGRRRGRGEATVKKQKFVRLCVGGRAVGCKKR